LGGSRFEAIPGKWFTILLPQNSQIKMDWRCVSSHRVPTLQTQSPEFKSQTHKKKLPDEWLMPVILAIQEAEFRRITV
jgi:hypothetical protein